MRINIRHDFYLEGASVSPRSGLFGDPLVIRHFPILCLLAIDISIFFLPVPRLRCMPCYIMFSNYDIERRCFQEKIWVDWIWFTAVCSNYHYMCSCWHLQVNLSTPLRGQQSSNWSMFFIISGFFVLMAFVLKYNRPDGHMYLTRSRGDVIWVTTGLFIWPQWYIQPSNKNSRDKKNIRFYMELDYFRRLILDVEASDSRVWSW